MEVRRTVPVKLDVIEDDAVLLHETIEQFRDAANYVIRHARDDDGYVITSKRRLHDRTYADVREATDLHANLVQAARSRAAEALKSVVATWRRGTYASLPRFTSPFLDYDQRCATFHDDHASHSTVGGRITAEYALPGETRETPHSSYLLSEDFETTGATLHYRETTDEFYLHVRTKADVDAPTRPRTARFSAWTSGSKTSPSRRPACFGPAMNSTTGTESTRSVGRPCNRRALAMPARR